RGDPHLGTESLRRTRQMGPSESAPRRRSARNLAGGARQLPAISPNQRRAGVQKVSSGQAPGSSLAEFAKDFGQRTRRQGRVSLRRRVSEKRPASFRRRSRYPRHYAREGAATPGEQ